MKRYLKLKVVDWIAIIIFAALAVAFLYLAEKIEKDATKMVLRQLATIASISGIITTILRRYSLVEVVEAVVNKTKVASEIIESGTVLIKNKVYDFDFRNEIRKCQKSIDINVIYGSTWLGNNLDCLANVIKEKKISVRFCFLNPNADEIIKILEKKFDEGKNVNLKQRINNSVDLIKRNLPMKEKTGSRVEIYFHSQIPQYCYYRFDSKIYFVPYFNSPGRTQVPIIGFEQTPESDSIFNFLSNDFEKLLAKFSEKLIEQ